MNPDERTAQNVRLFDTLSPYYDRMGFLPLTALHLARRVDARPGEALLDVMCGTGTLALAVADAVGTGGRVMGADLSPGMLAVARDKAAGQPQLSFVEADATALPFEDAEFDGVACASGLFFVPDMAAALREWGRVLRPGGRIMFSSFGKGMMGDLPGRWRAALGGVGFHPGFPPLGRLPSPDAAAELLREAGFEGVTAEIQNLPYLLPTPQDRWNDIQAGMEGVPLASLLPEVRRQLQTDHLAELEILFAGQPLTVPIPVLLAAGVWLG
ncbi:methyltransferase domain-containing protein [Deinococcus arenicola]|uniref:Methyltransferase domain-containing protein n=1 Tax=Deinococcus arenicola TaxID=2994950 RepID=A0ABU4DLT8_9DEIO|nr:methyltransferase domain-containing protein [Deinococcus sp. ZS9-10]MDV6373064.1 methyltransferase domain-containing protein [Deinococcus sp. ZS9-10]